MLSIKEFSEKTGINAVTLRAWERRYGLLVPKRSDKGHRLYSEENFLEVQEILDWLQRGVPISQVKPLLGDVKNNSLANSVWEQTIDQFFELIQNLKVKKLDEQLNELLAMYPISTLTEVFFPKLIHKVNTEKMPLASIGYGVFVQLLEAKLTFKLLNHGHTQSPQVIIVPLDGDTDRTNSLLISNHLLASGVVPLVLSQSHNLEDIVELSVHKDCYRVLGYGETTTSRTGATALFKNMDSLQSHHIELAFAGPAGKLVAQELAQHWLTMDLSSTLEQAIRFSTSQEMLEVQHG